MTFSLHSLQRAALCLLLLITGGTATSFAQSYSFLSYSTSNGLPQSQVTSINQDENGYLWIGTLSGLAKFNGKDFVNFSTDNGLVNNRITSLSIIGKELWVGHEGGISLMKNGKAEGWKFFGQDRAMNVSEILSFNGNIVAATNGGGLYILQEKTLRQVRMPSDDANLCRDLKVLGNELYIATRNGVYKTADLKHFKHLDAYGNRNVSSLSQRGTKLVVATFSEGLFESHSNYHSTRADSIPVRPEEYNIIGSFVDSKGQLWLNSRKGVVRINDRGQQLFLDERNGLPIASVNCIFEDREGIIWMGTEGKGLLRFTGEQFVYYSSLNGFPSDLILSAGKDRNGNYLFGSYDKGLFNMNRKGVITPMPTIGSAVWTLYSDDNGNLWTGTELGLSVHYRNGGTQNFYFGDYNNKVTVIKKINRKVLVGGYDGIGWIHNNTFTEIDLHTDFERTIGTVRDFAYFSGKLLCASDKGLFEIDPERGRFKTLKHFPSGAKSLAVDDNNRLWIGTENGLSIYDGIVFKPINIGTTNGSKLINFLVKIEEQLYVGTNNGLYVFDCDEEKPILIKRYGINDGLINLETNINSAFYDNRYLWFGTSEGLVRFDVKGGLNTQSDLRPLINITTLSLNYQPFDYLDYTSKLTPDGLPADLKLPYNKNNITIDLDGILLADPDGLRYQFWLEGQDETWSPPINNSSVVLANLGNGNYVLHVRTLNEVGVSSKEIRLPIYITPPFWGTWWFYTLIVLLLIFGIRMYFRWKIRQERERNYKENLENKTRLLSLEQQSLNASMNRHFIFNSLNSIQYFINTQDRISANRYLTNFAKLIRKNLDTAAEDDNVVSLQQELERLELYLSLEAMRFKDRFTYAIQFDGIDTEQVVVPAMLLQPFVENSIIHGILPDESKPGRIEIIGKIVDSKLEISIDDNGIGIDFSLTKKQAFNGDHKSQGMEITSKRIDLIRKMWKKDYELSGPFQLEDADRSIKGTRVLLKIPVENLEITE